MKFYISDTHFFHNNVLKFDNRPYKNVDEMNEDLISNWNSQVSNADEVYFLGDFSFGKTNKTNEALKQLNGIKYLIKGNHDGKFLKDQTFPKLWTGIYDIMFSVDEIDGIPVYLTLCHYPILSFKGRYRENYFHLYGHVHNSPEEKITLKFVDEIGRQEKKFNERAKNMTVNGLELSAKMYNVGCMMPYMNYAPQTLKTILLGGEKYFKDNLDQK